MSEDNIPSLPDFLTGASEIREEMLTSMPGPDARPILNNSHTWSFYTNPTARLASYTIHRFLKANASGMTPFVLKEQEEFKCDVEGSVPIVRTGMFALCYLGRVVKLEFVNGGDKQCITLASNDVDLGPLRQQIDEELPLRNPFRGKFIHVMEENTGDGIRFEVLPKPTVTIDDLILDATIKTDLLDKHAPPIAARPEQRLDFRRCSWHGQITGGENHLPHCSRCGVHRAVRGRARAV